MTADYSIARLSGWRGRRFDPADAFDWLDLLDDFGPALVRFLVDERTLADAPDSDGALRALRRQVREMPLATLKPVRGGVWVLFAYKDGLKGLPPPFRTDGVLLPFVWTERAEAPGGVPAGLAALADRVKEQFGLGASAWRLAPASCFGGRVDLDVPDATFDSAWGALASGLYLATHPKVPLAGWPFSSVAFDFTRNEPLPVGGLAAKIALAASFGAAEIAVAPVQRREAERTLAALRAADAGNRSLKAMRIFDWKWRGEAERAVAALVRCNQMTRRRRFLRTLCANAALVAMLSGVGAAYWLDWHREEVRQFADYADRYGVAFGLFPLDADSRLPGRYRFVSRGYDGIVPFRRHRVLREVWCVDGEGVPVRDRTARPEHRCVAGRRFVYGDDGRLRETRHLDADGRVLDVFRYSGRDLEVADVCGVDSNEVVRLGAVEFTSRAPRKGDSVRRLVYGRDANGAVISSAFQTGMEGGAARSGSGIARVLFERDSLGRIAEARYRTADGKAASDGRGIHRKLYRYENAFLACEERRSADGALKERIDYGGGVRRKVSVFQRDGGCDEHFCDRKGRVVRVEYRGKDGNLVVDADGVAIVLYDYDKTGKRRETLCGPDGRKIEILKTKELKGEGK